MTSLQPRGPRGIVFDVETHDKKAPRIIESAYGYVDENGRLDAETIVVERFNPGVPITYGAIATHHILDQDLVDCPPTETFSLPTDVGYVIGHNVNFDLGAAGNPSGICAIDTLALSRKAWPEMDSHTQSALFYMLHDVNGLDMAVAREFVKGAHSAATDIQMCGFIFDCLVNAYEAHIAKVGEILGRPATTLESMHMISRAAGVPLVMEFGKHKGMPTHLVPMDYKTWYRKTDAPDPNVLLAMDRGGSSPDGQTLFELAQTLFGAPAQPADDQSQGSFQQQKFRFGG